MKNTTINYADAIQKTSFQKKNLIQEQLEIDKEDKQLKTDEATANSTSKIVTHLQAQNKILTKINKGFDKFLFRIRDAKDDNKNKQDSSSIDNSKKTSSVVKKDKKDSDWSFTDKLAGLWAGKTILGKLGNLLRKTDKAGVKLLSKAIIGSAGILGIPKIAKLLKTTTSNKITKVVQSKPVQSIKTKANNVKQTIKQSKAVKAIMPYVPKTPDVIKKAGGKGIQKASKAVSVIKGIGSKIPYLNTIFAGYALQDGFRHAGDILDLKDVAPNLRQKLIGGISSAIDMFTIGIIDEKTVAKVADNYTSFFDDMFDFDSNAKEEKKGIVSTIGKVIKNSVGEWFKDGSYLNKWFGNPFKTEKKQTVKTHTISKKHTFKTRHVISEDKHSSHFQSSPMRSNTTKPVHISNNTTPVSNRLKNNNSAGFDRFNPNTFRYLDLDQIEGTKFTTNDGRGRTAWGGIDKEHSPKEFAMLQRGELTGSDANAMAMKRLSKVTFSKLPWLKESKQITQEVASILAMNTGGAGAAKFAPTYKAIDAGNYDEAIERINRSRLTSNHKARIDEALRRAKMEEESQASNVQVEPKQPKMIATPKKPKIEEIARLKKQKEEKSQNSKVENITNNHYASAQPVSEKSDGKQGFRLDSYSDIDNMDITSKALRLAGA